MKTKIRLSQLLVICCFFGFFLFCLVRGLAQPDRPSSAAENRSLAQRPAMRRVVTDFGGFAKDFESYAADQFPDREQLIGVYTALELAQGKKFARKAYCLQGGWLLTKPTPTNPADLSDLQEALTQAARTLDRPLVWCVLPLKNEALYDLEPAYFSDETGETNKQALTAALAQVGGLTVIDAEAPLVTGTLADRERYFYKTDFHWNARGAFAAAQEIARQLAGAGRIAETSVPQAEDFLWSELGGERRYQGDLNVWFSNQFSMQEDIPRYVPKSAAELRYFLHPGDTASVPRETIVGSGLDKDPVTYNDVFTYNLGYYRVENPAAPEAASVLILKDSFQNATIDYLSAIFRSVTVVDPRSYQETPDLASLLEADGIDLVLFFYHQNNVSRELIDLLTA